MPPMIDDGAANFTADELGMVSGDAAAAADADDDGSESSEGAGGDKAAADKAGVQSPEKAESADKAVKQAGEKAPLAAGGKTEPLKEPKGYWPEDWREKVAEHVSAGDKKVYDKELRRLQRISDPTSVYGFYREAEGRLTSGGLIKVPGKDAKPEEIAEYHKSLGVPEKPEGYLEDLTLENGAIIGDADKPMVNAALSAIHQAGAPPAVAQAMLNWYYTEQERQAADLDESDDSFKRESEVALKEEFGTAYQRNRNAVPPLFANAAGGTDLQNDSALIRRLLGGRMADGSVIGNDPDFIRWAVGLAREINPAATVTEDGDQSGKTIEAELAEIGALQKTDPKKYWSEPVQARELELIAAQQKLRAKA